MIIEMVKIQDRKIKVKKNANYNKNKEQSNKISKANQVAFTKELKILTTQDEGKEKRIRWKYTPLFESLADIFRKLYDN